MNRHSFFALLIAFALSLAPVTSSFALKDTNPVDAVKNKESVSDTDINRFTNAISDIKEYYVQPINDKKLLEDAIRGMLNGLDPHSEYLDTDAYKTLLMTTNG